MISKKKNSLSRQVNPASITGHRARVTAWSMLFSLCIVYAYDMIYSTLFSDFFCLPFLTAQRSIARYQYNYTQQYCIIHTTCNVLLPSPRLLLIPLLKELGCTWYIYINSARSYNMIPTWYSVLYLPGTWC